MYINLLNYTKEEPTVTLLTFLIKDIITCRDVKDLTIQLYIITQQP